MFSLYLMASFVLVGLSAARPQQTVTSDTAYTSSTTPTGTVASFDGQISSPAQLSKRHHHHHHDDEEGDWDDIASQAIGQIGGVLHSIIGIFGPHDDEKTESITTTVTENPGTTTITGSPGTITVTENPGTTTITTHTDKTTSPLTTGTITVTRTVTVT